ncbi:putative hydrolase [Helianthus annuus]|uniref:Hydrolase n=1 Tax=Helianthus annuus TaxID=4232 RepID=A0A9K3H0R7_HELAN|nr:putative hydrolase [Helianthus annuus]
MHQWSYSDKRLPATSGSSRCIKAALSVCLMVEMENLATQTTEPTDLGTSYVNPASTVIMFFVAGHFTYGVMAISAATFVFWSTVGTRILPVAFQQGSAMLNSNEKWSETDVLKLAAAVESNTLHPIGKAILEAARAAKCSNVKADDGTFMEEPGSGAVASCGKKMVSVGTLEWVRRHGVAENPFIETEEFKNQSVVYVGIDGVLAGLIYVEDQIREDAAKSFLRSKDSNP